MHEDHHHHHDHGHHHHGPNGHHHAHSNSVGHNGPAGRAVQWQTPHLPHSHEQPVEPGTQDIDLVEYAFMEGFARAPDASSFLRLAGIPFVGETRDGKKLHLLRVETEDMVDVGAVMPLVGGAGVTYHPLPAKLTSHRRRLAFVYHDGVEPQRLGFAAARTLADRSATSQLVIKGQ